MSQARKVLVSVIIPCYNGEKWVAEAIQAAIDQTCLDKEVIVVDDGSSDRSVEIIKGFGEQIRCEVQLHRGSCAARNRGVEIATGDYIQFLDADDLMEPSKIDLQIGELRKLSANSIATCPWNHFTSGGGHEPTSPRPFWKYYERAVDLLVDTWLLGGFFAPHCWLIPRDLIERVGCWNESLLADQDGEFFGRVLTRAANVAFVKQCSVHYRTPGRVNVSTSRHPRSIESRFQAWESVQSHLLARRNDSEARRAVLRRLRSVIYSYGRTNQDLVQKAADYESGFPVADFDPAMPPIIRYLIGVLGIERGLKVRNLFKS